MAVYVFDVNETLSDLTPMGTRFAEVGLPPTTAQLWFATLLRDGIAVAAAGGLVRFADVARGVLAPLLPGDEDAVEHVLAGFRDLPVHPDVPAGIRALRAAGHRLLTLSNGAATVADGLLARAGVRGDFEQLLSVEDAGVWKPARRGVPARGPGLRAAAGRADDGRGAPVGHRRRGPGRAADGLDGPDRRRLSHPPRPAGPHGRDGGRAGLSRAGPTPSRPDRAGPTPPSPSRAARPEPPAGS